MKTLKDWLGEGEELYNAALKDYQAIEHQLDDLERRLTEKKAEVNQIASVIGKSPVESSRRLTAQLVEEHGPNSVPNSPATIARGADGPRVGTLRTPRTASRNLNCDHVGEAASAAGKVRECASLPSR